VSVFDVLVPLEALRLRSDRIRDVTSDEAYSYYTLFGDATLVERAGLGRLDDRQLFYNRYYWFKRFAAALAAVDGYDAGIEQQAFKLLENAPPDVEWSFIEQIDHDTGGAQQSSSTRT
jgi:hypothetical protein